MKIPLFSDDDFRFEVYTDVVNPMTNAINDCDWFARVGKDDFESVERVSCWSDAMNSADDHPNDYSYGYYLNELLGNEVRVYASTIHRNRYNKLWGKGHDLVAKPLMKLMEKEVFPRMPIKNPSHFILSGISGAFLEPLVLALLYGRIYPP
jgi:hypothetical protein